MLCPLKTLFDKACEAIRSPYMVKNHCKSKMGFIKPVSYTIGGASGNKVGQFSYEPITQVLQIYCSLEDVWEQMVADVTKARDGEVWESTLIESASGNIHSFKTIHRLFDFIFMKMSFKL